MKKDVVDLFTEELNKKDKKINKKIEKQKLKEEKLKRKRELELEKKEDREFNNYLEQIKKEEVLDNNQIEEFFEKELPKKKSSFSVVITIILSIILIVISLDFTIYNVINNTNIKLAINNGILILTIFFYLLSIFKTKRKSFYQIFSIIGFALYMLYNLYVI